MFFLLDVWLSWVTTGVVHYIDFEHDPLTCQTEISKIIFFLWNVGICAIFRLKCMPFGLTFCYAMQWQPHIFKLVKCPNYILFHNWLIGWHTVIVIYSMRWQCEKYKTVYDWHLSFQMVWHKSYAHHSR